MIHMSLKVLPWLFKYKGRPTLNKWYCSKIKDSEQVRKKSELIAAFLSPCFATVDTMEQATYTPEMPFMPEEQNLFLNSEPK